MKLQTKIYMAAGIAAVLITIVITNSMWSNHKIASATRAAQTARQAAAEKETLAAEKATEAAAYKAKNEYLEARIAELQALARRQDEELEKLKSNTGNARRDVGRARSVRSVETTEDDLCRKLAEVGHGCE